MERAGHVILMSVARKNLRACCINQVEGSSDASGRDSFRMTDYVRFVAPR
jgi:hypothetical protein